MATFSSEQLNFFKFSTVVFEELPIALRQVFADLWDTLVAPLPGFKKWDDSLLVRNLFLNKEGGKTRYVPTSKSYHDWDCTALFEATLYSKSFSVSDGKGGFATLAKMYVTPRGVPHTAFHPSVLSPSGNNAETNALALDQLRRLRNTLCHQISTKEIVKADFDNYIHLAKDALQALGLNSTKIDSVVNVVTVVTVVIVVTVVTVVNIVAIVTVATVVSVVTGVTVVNLVTTLTTVVNVC